MLQIVLYTALIVFSGISIVALIRMKMLSNDVNALAEYRRLKALLPAMETVYRRQGSGNIDVLRSLLTADRYLKKCDELSRKPRNMLRDAKERSDHEQTIKHMARMGLRHLEHARRRMIQIEEERHFLG